MHLLFAQLFSLNYFILDFHGIWEKKQGQQTIPRIKHLATLLSSRGFLFDRDKDMISWVNYDDETWSKFLFNGKERSRSQTL